MRFGACIEHLKKNKKSSWRQQEVNILSLMASLHISERHTEWTPADVFYLTLYSISTVLWWVALWCHSSQTHWFLSPASTHAPKAVGRCHSTMERYQEMFYTITQKIVVEDQQTPAGKANQSNSPRSEKQTWVNLLRCSGLCRPENWFHRRRAHSHHYWFIQNHLLIKGSSGSTRLHFLLLLHSVLITLVMSSHQRRSQTTSLMISRSRAWSGPHNCESINACGDRDRSEGHPDTSMV